MQFLQNVGDLISQLKFYGHFRRKMVLKFQKPERKKLRCIFLTFDVKFIIMVGLYY